MGSCCYSCTEADFSASTNQSLTTFMLTIDFLWCHVRCAKIRQTNLPMWLGWSKTTVGSVKDTTLTPKLLTGGFLFTSDVKVIQPNPKSLMHPGIVIPCDIKSTISHSSLLTEKLLTVSFKMKQVVVSWDSWKALWMVPGNVFGEEKQDPELTRGMMYPLWPSNALGSPRKSWRVSLE